MENVQTINDSDMSDSVKKETITTVNILFFPSIIMTEQLIQYKLNSSHYYSPLHKKLEV